MDPLQYLQSLTELWSRGQDAMLETHRRMTREMAGYGRTAGDPDSGFLQLDPAAWQSLNASGEAFSKLWSSALEMSAKVLPASKEGSVDPLVTEMLARILDPRAWLSTSNDLVHSLDRFAEGPRLADLWENERRLAAVLKAWVDLRKASLDHHTILLDAWMRAAGAFSRRLNEKAETGEELESWRQILALWVETANEEILHTQRTEGFLEAQRELLNAATELRLAQRECARYYSDTLGLPTREELDDVYRTVTELRRELRALKRGVETRPTAAPRATGGTDRPKAPRTPKKKKAAGSP